MELIYYLINHKNFARIILFNFFLFIIYWLITGYYQEGYIELTTEILVFMISYPCLFYWQGVFQRNYECSFVRFRLMSKYHCSIETVYKIVNLFLSCAYGLVIGIMIMLISGGFSSINLVAMSLANILFIMTMYSLFTLIYSQIYIKVKKTDKPILSTISLSTTFSIWLFLNRVLVDLYSNTNLYVSVMLFLILSIVLLMNINKIKYRLAVGKVLPYTVLAFIYFFQTRVIFEMNFESFITLSLRNVEINNMITLIIYITWIISRFIIVAMIAAMFTSYMSTNYYYFKIRGRYNAWFGLILKKTFKIVVTAVGIQLLVAFLVSGLYPKSVNDMLLLMTSQIYIIILAFIYMLAYQLLRTPKVLLCFLGISFIAGMLVIQSKNEFLMDFMFQQNFDLIIFLIYMIFCVGLLLFNMYVLKTKKD